LLLINYLFPKGDEADEKPAKKKAKKSSNKKSDDEAEKFWDVSVRFENSANSFIYYKPLPAIINNYSPNLAR